MLTANEKVCQRKGPRPVRGAVAGKKKATAEGGFFIVSQGLTPSHPITSGKAGF